MSIRTIVEFNHDYLCNITDDQPTFLWKLREALNSNDDAAWDILSTYFGVRRISCHHHSDDRSVLINKREIKL